MQQVEKCATQKKGINRLPSLQARKKKDFHVGKNAGLQRKVWSGFFGAVNHAP